MFPINKEKEIKIVKNSLFILLMILSLLLIMSNVFSGMQVNDYFWHYKVGEWIVKNKQVPNFGLFSWYALENNLYWFSHEWLSEVLLYLISFNSAQIALFISALLCFIFILLISLLNKDKIKDNSILFILYTIFCAKILSEYFYPRPHMFSYFLFFFELYVLYDFIKKENSKLIFFLPLISVLWSNIHGGSSNLIYIIPIFFIISSSFNFEFGKIKLEKIENKRLLKLTIITFISTLALTINPHGFKIITYPYENMANDFMLTVINEWAAPNIKTTNGLFFCIPVVIIALILLTTTKKIKCYDFLIFLFFIYMYLRSERFIALFIISSFFYIYEYSPKYSLNSIVNWKKNFKIALYTFVFTSSICISVIYLLDIINQDNKIEITDTQLSENAIEIIKKTNSKRIYNHYNLGGELIYNDIFVFIDGRADMYSGYNFEDFYRLSHYALNKDSSNNMQELIDKYQFDLFVCTKKELLNVYLQNSNLYDLIYEDEFVNIYIPIDIKIPNIIYEETIITQNIMDNISIY